MSRPEIETCTKVYENVKGFLKVNNEYIDKLELALTDMKHSHDILLEAYIDEAHVNYYPDVEEAASKISEKVEELLE